MTVPVRRKLWEHEDYQCPILGTCLSMTELRKLARKLDVTVQPSATDYELHVFFVHECRKEGPIASYIHKYLDKKYRKHIRFFAKASEPTALEAMWKHSLKSGDIPGPFWALMSHPDTGTSLSRRAFGEIHMLSHLMGAANRADLKRLGKLESRLDELSQALSRVQALRRSQKMEWAVRVRELEDRLESERQERLKLSRMVRESALPRSEPAPADAAALRDQLEASQNETRRQAAIIEELYRENAQLRERLEDVSADLERAELELVRVMPCAEGGGCLSGDACRQGSRQGSSCREASCPACSDGTDGSCPQAQDCDVADCPALSGKKVLYVGGRCNLVRHYREMVERMGCRFHHHDGGVENSTSELYGKLAAADVVLCPVDCVSHEACQSVKKACKHCMKPFMMLRSSGLSALARSLDQLAERAN